ncbi:MAG: hypothetical protein LWX52_10900 [Deltaproteobacteria bacterium]|jgi:hypothetical protein|nr:hypothetical protein [Deltaproteobacteria bacterium]
MTQLLKRLPDDNEKLQLLVGEISWSENLIIMRGNKENPEREFHIAYCDLLKVQPTVAQIGWSHNLNIFKRAQTKFAVKDKYTFDFLEMGKELNTMAVSLASTIEKNVEELEI